MFGDISLQGLHMRSSSIQRIQLQFLAAQWLSLVLLKRQVTLIFWSGQSLFHLHKAAEFPSTMTSSMGMPLNMPLRANSIWSSRMWVYMMEGFMVADWWLAVVDTIVHRWWFLVSVCQNDYRSRDNPNPKLWVELINKTSIHIIKRNSDWTNRVNLSIL